MQDKKVIVLVILGILAVFSLINGIVTPSKVRREYSLKSTSFKEKAIPAVAKRAVSTARSRARSTYSAWGRSPFVLHSKASRELILNGIVWDKESPYAMINKEIVRTGDKIIGNTVIEIKTDRVILSDGVKHFELRLGED